MQSYLLRFNIDLLLLLLLLHCPSLMYDAAHHAA